MVSRAQFYEDLGNVLSRIDELELQADTCAAYLNTGLSDSPKKEFFEVLFYISSISCELRRFMGMVASDEPYSFTWIDKYLALVIRESLETMPVVFNRLVRAASGGNKVNEAILRKGVKEFKRAVKADIDMLDMEKTFDIVRNSVSAHHLDKEGTLKALIAWHTATRSAQLRGVKPEGKTVLLAAVLLANRLADLATALRDADDAGYLNELKAFYVAGAKTYSLNNSDVSPSSS